MKFQIDAEMSRVKLTKVNQEEFKFFRNILLVLTGVVLALSGVLVIYDLVNQHLILRDFINLAIGIILASLFWLLPKLYMYIQIPIFTSHQLDGKRHIFISDDGIEIQSEKYANTIKINLSDIKQIYDRDTYFKIIIEGRSLFIHKEDFVIGTPEEFMKYFEEKFNN